jgi:hypothetical protein
MLPDDCVVVAAGAPKMFCVAGAEAVTAAGAPKIDWEDVAVLPEPNMLPAGVGAMAAVGAAACPNIEPWAPLKMFAVVAAADEDTLGAPKLNPVAGAAEAGVNENPPIPPVVAGAEAPKIGGADAGGAALAVGAAG